MISCKEYVETEKNNIKELINNSNRTYRLDIIQIGDNPASNSYIKGKIKDCEEVGIKAKLHKFDETIDEAELITNIIMISNTDTNGIILQLPVPNHINPDTVINKSILGYQDVDGFLNNSHYSPCTPKGIIDYLNYNNIEISGKHIVVIGRSNIVGKPLAKLLVNLDATVTLCHSKTTKEQLDNICANADIIIVAVGKPKWFKCDVNNNPIIIDVGINRDENNKLCGDVDNEYMKNQNCYVTPVPGGVGLLTRLALLKNIIE